MNEVELFRLIGSISRTATTEMNHSVSQYGLNNNLFLYLLRIVEHEGITQSELANLSKIDKTTISRAISKLEQKGYIVNVTNQKRYKELYPTDKAREIYNEVSSLEHSFVDKALSKLTPIDLVNLNKILGEIYATIA